MIKTGEIKLKTGWWFSELPEYREHSKPSTYSYFPYEELPLLSVTPDNDFTWLKVQSKLEGSMHEPGYSDSTLPDLSKIDKIEKRLDVVLPNLPKGQK